MTISADLTLPNGIKPSVQTWRQLSRTALFLGGSTTQRIGRNAPRWSCSMTFSNLDGLRRRQVLAFLTECQGALKTALIPNYAVPDSPATTMREYLTDADDLTGAGWTVQDSAIADADTGRTRLRNGSAGSSGYVDQTITGLADGSYYAVQGFGRVGNSTPEMFVGDSPTGNTLLNWTSIVGRSFVTPIIRTASTDVLVKVRGASTTGLDDDSYVDWVSFARCGRVDGAGQTGNTLNVKNMQGIPALNARGGDMIEVNGQLLLLTVDAIRNDDMSGLLQFEPPLRASPALNDAVIFHRPRCRMHLDANSVEWQDAPHVEYGGSGLAVSTVTVTFVEALD